MRSTGVPRLVWRGTLGALLAVTVGALAACQAEPTATSTHRSSPSVSATASPTSSTSESPASPRCLPAPSATPTVSTWPRLRVTPIDVTHVRSTTLAQRTDLLPLGPEPQVPWLVRGVGTNVLHFRGHEYHLGRQKFVHVLGDGYVTAPVERFGPPTVRYRFWWHRPGHAPQDLGRGSNSGPGYASAVSPAGDFAWINNSDGPWTFVSTRLDGCREQLHFRAFVTTPGIRSTDCEAVMLGAVGAHEFAVDFECYDRDGNLEVHAITTAGRVIHYPGMRGSLGYLPGRIVLEKQRLLLGQDQVSVAARVRGYNLLTGEPLWAHRYTVNGRSVAWRFLASSPSGRTALVGSIPHALVIDTRTGAPVRRLTLPKTVDEASFEDEQHLMLTDNGQVDVHGERTDPSTPPRSSWLVRCSLDGACERVTPIPRGPVAWMSVAEYPSDEWMWDRPQ